MRNPVTKVFDKDGSPYLTRISLTPRTRWGQLKIHVFHRGDADPDPHDHPWNFWTFPLHTYVEDVMDGHRGTMEYQVVRRFRWHRREAWHAHRVVGRAVDKWWTKVYQTSDRPFVTLVWTGPKIRRWGFWVGGSDPRCANMGWEIQSNPINGTRIWMHWRTYIYGTPEPVRSEP